MDLNTAHTNYLEAEENVAEAKSRHVHLRTELTKKALDEARIEEKKAWSIYIKVKALSKQPKGDDPIKDILGDDWGCLLDDDEFDALDS